MKILIGLVSLGVGQWVVIKTRHWFFESDDEYWNNLGDGFNPRLTNRSFIRRYVQAVSEKPGRLEYVSWLMMGLVISLLVYAILNMLFL